MTLNEKGLERCKALTKIYEEVLKDVDALYEAGLGADPVYGKPQPGQREMALFRTNIQQGMMWATTAFTMLPGNKAPK